MEASSCGTDGFTNREVAVVVGPARLAGLHPELEQARIDVDECCPGKPLDLGWRALVPNVEKQIRLRSHIGAAQALLGQLTRERIAVRRGQSDLFKAVRREEPLEVDGVLEGSWGSWAVEIKSARFASRELDGLFEFCKRYPAFRPLVITRAGDEDVARRFGVDAMSWVDFLTRGLSSA